MKLMFRLFLTLLIPTILQARPVSYPGGWTIMNKNSEEVNSTHIHYSPTAKDSIGLKYEYRSDYNSNGYYFQYNRLLKRLNQANSQANFYFKNAFGLIDSKDQSNFTAFTEFTTDFETRNVFTFYSAKYFYANQVEKFFEQSMRLGFSPWNSSYGEKTWWFMLEARHMPINQDQFKLIPFIRLFEESYLIELGYDFDNNYLFNFIKRF